jgi:capsular polysaccharide biosynthesis protein
MSVSEQIKAFLAADIVIGPSGAAFANLAHSRTGTTLIEFMPEATWRAPQIMNFAQTIGMDYHRILCHGGFNDDYFDVNIEELRHLFHTLAIQ